VSTNWGHGPPVLRSAVRTILRPRRPVRPFWLAATRSGRMSELERYPAMDETSALRMFRLRLYGQVGRGSGLRSRDERTSNAASPPRCQ
jgi:hypothetical protein